MSDQKMAPGDRADHATPDDPPTYRVSHMMDELADAFADRDMVQMVAPFSRGGIKPRVKNRVTFRASDGLTDGRENTRITEDVLESDGWSWTTGDIREYVVLGRVIHDIRELRKDDRVHINSRRGPFQVYRVMEHAPEVLQRSDPAITVELRNLDTDTDWMMVHWSNEPDPWTYVRTRDERAKGGFRYKKVEQVERMGRIGPYRLYAPDHDHVSEGYQDDVADMIRDADDAGGLGDLHPSDVERALNLVGDRPAAEVYTPTDADTLRGVLEAVSEYHEREADALAIESDDDRDHAARHQELARDAERYASAWNLTTMDAVERTEDTDIWECEDCGKAFLDKFKYPTHRRECPEKSD